MATRPQGRAPNSPTTAARPQRWSSNSGCCQFAASCRWDFQFSPLARTIFWPSANSATNLTISPAGPGSVLIPSAATTIRPGAIKPVTSHRRAFCQALLPVSLSPTGLPFRYRTNILSQVAINSADFNGGFSGTSTSPRK